MRGKFIPVYAVKAYGGITPLIPDLMIRWMKAVSRPTWPLYARENSPLTPRIGRLGGRCGQHSSLLPLAESRTAISQVSSAWPTRYRPTDWADVAVRSTVNVCLCMIYLAKYRNGMGEAVGWIDLAQDWDRWRAVANAVMNRRVA